MEKVYKQKEIIYKDMKEKIELKLKEKMENFNRIKTKINETIKNFREQVRNQLQQHFQISGEKANVLKKFNQEIQWKQRQRDYRFNLYVTYRSRKQPLCLLSKRLLKFISLDPSKVQNFGWIMILNKYYQKLKNNQDQQELKRYDKKKDLIICTLAGRKAYLQIVYKSLLKQRNSFFKWNLWFNTVNPEDVEYLNKLGKQNDWIKLIKIQNLNPSRE